MFEKEITLIIAGVEYGFKISTQDYNRYVDDIKMDDKVAPSTRFVRSTLADKKQRPALDELINNGYGVDIASKLMEEFKPDLEIEVKK